jgi:hypothetical protein
MNSESLTNADLHDGLLPKPEDVRTRNERAGERLDQNV